VTAALAAGLRAFVEELVRAGLCEVVVCPGSRSTPMALALAAHEGLRVHVLLDERSAAFAAFGMAKVARRPVAVLVTSGTAAAELLPAAAEANLARVPLVLLTADRPAELRDRGAAQTIDQVGLFSTHVRWAAEVPLMDGASQTVAHWRWLAARAMAEARGSGRGAGPVHLDLPYREPLVPDGPLGSASEEPGPPFITVIEAPRVAGPAELDALRRSLVRAERPLLVVGPHDEPIAGEVARFASTAGFPVLADGLTDVRGQVPSDRGDLLVRPGPWLERHRPDLVIRIGAIPTSRWVNELIAAPTHELWVIDEADLRQPAARPSTILHARAGQVLDTLADGMQVADRPPSPWLEEWRQARASVDAALRAWMGALDEPFEGLPFHVLPNVVTEPTRLWVGSSMPVRDLDAWFAGDTGISVLASRGANGIDGVTSAAAGAAAVHDGPVVLVTGDVSFVHDLGALVTARLLGAALTVVVIDNDGGGIFSFLAQATTDRPEVGLPERFERLFGTPHGTRVADVAAALGAAVSEVDHRSLETALRAAIGDRSPGVRLLRYATDRRRNVELHAQAARVAADVLARLAGGA